MTHDDHDPRDPHTVLMIEAIREASSWHVVVAACSETDVEDLLHALTLIDDAIADVRRGLVATIAGRN